MRAEPGRLRKFGPNSNLSTFLYRRSRTDSDILCCAYYLAAGPRIKETMKDTNGHVFLIFQCVLTLKRTRPPMQSTTYIYQLHLLHDALMYAVLKFLNTVSRCIKNVTWFSNWYDMKLPATLFGLSPGQAKDFRPEPEPEPEPEPSGSAGSVSYIHH